MSTITLPNIRVSSDLTAKVRLKDGGVAIDWSTLSNIKACIYSDAQRALAGRCAFSIDEENNTLLVCTYAANKPQYLGVNRIVISAKYMGETKTYDKPAFTFVRWTADQEGEEITIDDPDVDVEIDVEDVSSSILQEAVDAAFTAADRANEAAEAAEHMVDIHTGPEGKSAYEVAVEEGYTGTEEEWLASLKGDTGETPDITIGTVTTAEPGTPAAATMTGTPEAPVLNLTIPKGAVGATPNFTVGTVTTGDSGTPVVVTITGTPEAPVLNVTIPQGMQGNTGSSVEYPYELVNNLTTNDATKGLSAAQGYVLDGKVSQLEAELVGIIDNGTTYSEKFGSTNRTLVFYPLDSAQKAGIYTIDLSDIVLPTGNRICIRFTSSESPYSSALVQQVLYTATAITGYTCQLSADNIGAAEFLMIGQETGDADTCSFKAKVSNSISLKSRVVGLETRMGDAENAISSQNGINTEIKGDIAKNSGHISLIDGIIDPGTTYDTKDSYNRVCVYYPIPDVNGVFQIKVSDVSLSDNTNSLKIAVKSAATPYVATDLQKIGNSFRVDTSEVFTIDADNKSAAKYIAVIQETANGDASFNVELRIIPNYIELNATYIDDGSELHSDKFLTTRRTCAFYPLLDKNATYKIKITDAVVPVGTKLRVAIQKANTPYTGTPTGNILETVALLNPGADEYKASFTIPSAVKDDAAFIGICQVDANDDLCCFRAVLFKDKSAASEIEKLREIVDEIPNVSEDEIPYNDSIFVGGRTIKIYNPYKNGGNNQYTGQMHCHSWSYQTYNGVTYKVPISGYTVEQIAAMTEEQRAAAVESVNEQFAAAHKTVGYDFMTITNYDNFADYTPRPIVFPSNFLWLGNGFEGNTGGWDSTGVLEDQGAHICVINTDFGKRFDGWQPKDVVKYCEDRNCFVVWAHPFIKQLYASPSYVKLIKKRLRFIEVFNGLTEYHLKNDNTDNVKTGVELDEDFDALLTQGNFIFCTAISDMRTVNTTSGVLEMGCVKVFANELSHKAIVQALMEGNFYATDNLANVLNGISLVDNVFTIDVGMTGIVVEFLDANDTILSTVTTSAGNTVASYTIVGTEKFVRARLYEPGIDPSDKRARSKQMWTQAIRLSPRII